MIRQVRLKNWKSHLDSRLSFKKGVNALIGEMGSGKSSVLEGISFALYGLTPSLQNRTLKIENLIRRFPQKVEEAEVEVEFEFNDEVYSVKRKINSKGSEAEVRKNGSLLEGPSSKKVTELVQEILKMDFDLFSRAVYSEQNNLDYFMNLSPSERKKKIDALLKLDLFENVRKNSITLSNIVKKTISEREKDLSDEDFDELLRRKENVKKEIFSLDKEIESLRKESERLKKDVSIKTENYKLFLEKKKDFESLKEEKNKVVGNLTGIKMIIEKERIDVSEKEVVAKISESMKQINEMENLRIMMEDTRNKISAENSRLSGLNVEIRSLEESEKKFEKFEIVEKELKEELDNLEKITVELREIRLKIENLNEVLDNLSKSDGICPVCEEVLSEEKRNKLIDEKKKMESELNGKILGLEKEKSEISRKAEVLKKERDELLRFKGSGEIMSEKEAEREKIHKLVESFAKDIGMLKEKYDDDKLERLREEKSKLENLRKVFELIREKEVLEEKLEILEKKTLEIAFDDEKFELIKNELFELRNRMSLNTSEIGGKVNLKAEKEKLGKMLEEKVEKIENMEKELRSYGNMTDFMEIFNKNLEIVQIKLREEFNESLNILMDEIWKEMYPYQDYQEIRLRGGEDYIVELRDSEGNWVSAEGQVSGGERHTAALVLRIALSVILSPSLRILILDEPTHNLDSIAVEKLSENLREKVQEFVDQLFLITHDEKMENCVTGNLYKFKKKGTQNGLTEIEEVVLI